MREAGRWLWDVRTPMRDGVELSTDLHLPPAGLPGGPYPVVLVRTAANNQAAGYVKRARALTDHGYAVALQDVRGREDSDGSFAPFRNEGPDGYDTVEWLAAQDWCTGAVAMMGTGYAGWTQWAAAREQPPHLRTLVSTSAWAPGHSAVAGALPLPTLAWLHAMSARVWQEAGQVQWERVLRHLPLRTVEQTLGCRLPAWQEWLSTPADGSAMAFTRGDFEAIDLPVLHLTGWHDAAQSSAFGFLQGMLTHSPSAKQQRQVIGPWDEAGTWTPAQLLGDVDFGAPSCLDLDQLHRAWFSHWLGAPGTTEPVGSRFFVTGRNEWEAGSWASATADETAWYLHSDGTANTQAGNGTLSIVPSGHEPPDTYTYDPSDPVLVTTDFTFFPSAPKQPAQLVLDRRFVERRPDVLVYTSQVLTEDLELRGTPVLQLCSDSDRVGTDWFVQLSDVAPSGQSLAVATGGLRATHPEPSVPTQLAIILSGVAHVFRPGHRLRVSITSSWFPLFDRNLNTGAILGEGSEALLATNRVHHDGAHPSRITLPVVVTRKGDK